LGSSSEDEELEYWSDSGSRIDSLSGSCRRFCDGFDAAKVVALAGPLAVERAFAAAITVMPINRNKIRLQSL
jgi:hypothetical protein